MASDLKVGDIVALRVDCLRNASGTLGVVFYDYGSGVKITAETAERLEYYSALSYHPDLKNRLVKAVRYMEEFEKLGTLSTRKTATIFNVIRACVNEMIIRYNTSPNSEAYWCS